MSWLVPILNSSLEVITIPAPVPGLGAETGGSAQAATETNIKEAVDSQTVLEYTTTHIGTFRIAFQSLL